MEDFSSTGQLVTLGLVDSSIGAMAKGLTLIDVEISIAKELLSPNLLIGHIDCPISKCRFGNFSSTIKKLSYRGTPTGHIDRQ